MLTASAIKVARMIEGPMKPTTFDPVVKSPTPITDPAVMVTASLSPNERLRGEPAGCASVLDMA